MESRTDWDENLPKGISSAYLEWRSKLVCLRHLESDRFVLSANQSRDIALHFLCDASEKGYAACVYVLSTGSDDLRKSMLLAAKSKVPPMKTQSLPRLELCAVLLGVRLLHSIVQSLRQMQIVASEGHGWSDSTIVLCWLSQEPKYWSTFVANRVSELQENSDVVWTHVPTEDNPADPASRGLDTSLLQKCSLWWKGPEWLISGTFPDKQNIIDTHEEKKTKSFQNHESEGFCSRDPTLHYYREQRSR